MSARSQSSARQPPEFLAVGRVVRPHGIRGDLLVESYSEVFDSLRSQSAVYLGDQHRSYQVRWVRGHRGQYLMALEGLADREAAGELRGMDISVRMESTEPLPEGVYYRWQILGLAVLDEQGGQLGSIAEILETGANDVYVVEDPSGRQMLLPAIESVIRKVDLDSESITVVVPEGLQFGA